MFCSSIQRSSSNIESSISMAESAGSCFASKYSEEFEEKVEEDEGLRDGTLGLDGRREVW